MRVQRLGPGPRGTDEMIRISMQVPSDLDLVQEAIETVAGQCLACGLSAHQVEFSLRVALGEALQNAIVYGNRLDPDKLVDLQVHMGARKVEVFVEDEGDGFDPTMVPDPTRPDRLEREDGRGLFLIRNLVDHVSFNDQGNSICMVLHRA